MKFFFYLSSVLVLFISLLVLYNLTDNQQKVNEINKEVFDAPGRAGLRDFEMMKDPGTGQIPFKRFSVALTETKLKQSLSKFAANINWTQIPSNMGGRTKTLCIDPNDPTHHKVWAGSATGGLWVNQDISNSSSTWMPVGDVWETLAISAIVFDPNNPQIMYVGTGEYETAITDMYRESSGRGYGIWKSSDGGQSFSRLLTTQNFAYISDLVIKNNNGQSVLYAGVVSGIYRGHNFNAQPSEGLYRSYDGGQTWEQVLPNIPNTNKPYAVSDIEITGNGQILVGTKRNQDDLGGGHILYSDTGNPGSWTVINQFATQIGQDNDYNIPGRVKLASAPGNPDKIYAVFAAKSLQQTIEGFPQTIGKILATSNNGGQTWQTLSIPQNYGDNWAYLAWHALSISVDPNNADRVFIGGLDTYLSENGGYTWQQISDWAAMYYGGGDDYVHADIHKILFLSSQSGELVISTDGGVFYTATANTNNIIFEPRNKSYNTLQFYSAAINKSDNNDYLSGGLQDNGTVVYWNSPITESDMIQGGDGAFCRFDDDEPLLISSTYDNQFKVTNYQNGQSNYLYGYASGLFTSTFDYDSQNNTIWAIASDLHNNRADQVLKLTDVANHENGSFLNLNTGASTYFSAIRLIDNNQLLIGTANGHLYKVTNINSNPVSQELGAGVFPNAFMSCIQTASNGQNILVTLSNYGVASVWYSQDGGQTWQNVEGNLPDMPVRWAIFHPQNHNQVMLATETGIWTTDNIETATVVWTPQNNGFPNVRVDMLDVKPANNKVVAGTHGRGFFTATWDQTNGINNEIAPVDFTVYPNPATDYIHLKADLSQGDISIINLNGQVLQSFKHRPIQKPIDVSHLKSGYYLLRVNQSVKPFLVR